MLPSPGSPEVAAAAPVSPPPFELGEVGQVTAAARLLLSAVTSSARWIHRRVESIDLTEDDTALRRISLDLTPPEGVSGVPLPLALLPRRGTALVQARNQEGRLLPVLTAEESAEICFTALVLAAADHGLAMDGEEEDLLLQSVVGSARQAQSAARRLVEIQPAWNDDDELDRPLSLLAEGRPLFVFLGDPGRQIVSLEFEPLPMNSERRPLVSRPSLRGRASVLLEPESWPASSSFHLNLSAPEMTEITAARLIGAKHAEVDVYSGRAPRAHVYFREVEADRPLLLLEIAPRPLLTAGLLSLAASVLALLAGIGIADAAGGGVATELGLLLLLPAVLALHLVGKVTLSGGGLSASLLRGPLLLVLGGAVLGALATVGTVSELAAAVTLGIGLLATVLPLPSAIRNLARDWQSRRPPPLHAEAEAHGGPVGAGGDSK